MGAKKERQSTHYNKHPRHPNYGLRFILFFPFSFVFLFRFSVTHLPLLSFFPAFSQVGSKKQPRHTKTHFELRFTSMAKTLFKLQSRKPHWPGCCVSKVREPKKGKSLTISAKKPSVTQREKRKKRGEGSVQAVLHSDRRQSQASSTALSSFTSLLWSLLLLLFIRKLC